MADWERKAREEYQMAALASWAGDKGVEAEHIRRARRFERTARGEQVIILIKTHPEPGAERNRP